MADDSVRAEPSKGSHASKRKVKRHGNPEAMMSLGEHLAEFRKRLVLSLAAISVMTVFGWYLSDPIFAILQGPFLSASKSHNGPMSITFNGVASAFNMRLQIGIFVGVVASSPWWVYQLWAFINPGLKRKERWTAVAFIAASIPLFLTGAWLAWAFLPQAVAILADFAPANTATLLSADVYFTFIIHMTVAFGLAFLLPVVMVALTMMDVVSWKTWLHGWRMAIVAAFVFAAVATPTGDIGTLCALGLPICGIYGLAVFACWLCGRIQVLKLKLLLVWWKVRDFFSKRKAAIRRHRMRTSDMTTVE
ncbi:twin-arginine translocase subunit TatC [Bifidobacterium sp. ESL0704]|uniref:twin-arginine translocase subunit TatC n=1 Tax=Bifidobacterium sp. ESL0704 TaxID=2983219 RepID=UPI0023F6EC79|nr:twin-arginine translocase subunit TatC [Bifidobacterium sp. ESL0704]WEV53183.1 twin-arginine translocase subunit TatC [Bifidobacterium sp. ESL0704]